MLNAFRHQRMDHITLTADPFTSSRCSTPFGINEWITRIRRCNTGPEVCAQRLSASTNGSRNRHLIPVWAIVCSTPFGINEWITRISAKEPRQRTPSAQRLSASTNGSRNCHRPRSPRGLCSTPFGINEWITPLTPDRICLVVCAQRLSASTNGSPSYSSCAIQISHGAQRLSASTNGSLPTL